MITIMIRCLKVCSLLMVMLGLFTLTGCTDTSEPAVPHIVPDEATVAQAETTVVQTEPTVSDDLEQCRELLTTIQNSNSYHISSYHQSDKIAQYDYWKTGDDWYYQLQMQTAVDGETQEDIFANMCRGGESYSGTYFSSLAGKGFDEDSKLTWLPAPGIENVTPWLIDCNWDEQEVEHISTTPTENGTCIQVRILSPYETTAAVTEDYTVDFYFDETGSFMEVVMQADYVETGVEKGQWSRTETTRIITTDDEAVAADIEKACHQAVEQSRERS